MIRFYEITFPAFKLPDDIHINREGTVLSVERVDGIQMILDDTSMSGDTLGARRLYLRVQSPELVLFKLNHPIYDFKDLLHSEYKNFIDSAGKVFKYYKSKSAKVHSYEVDSYEPVANGFVVNIKNLHCKFFINYAPQITDKYAEVLHVDMGFVLYKLNHQQVPDYKVRI